MGLVERFASLPLKYVLIVVAIVKFGLVLCLCSLDYCTSADPEPVSQLFEFILKEHSYFRHLTLNMRCKVIAGLVIFFQLYTESLAHEKSEDSDSEPELQKVSKALLLNFTFDCNNDDDCKTKTKHCHLCSLYLCIFIQPAANLLFSLCICPGCVYI